MSLVTSTQGEPVKVVIKGTNHPLSSEKVGQATH